MDDGHFGFKRKNPLKKKLPQAHLDPNHKIGVKSHANK